MSKLCGKWPTVRPWVPEFGFQLGAERGPHLDEAGGGVDGRRPQRGEIERHR
jgi:hypothetical protein